MGDPLLPLVTPENIIDVQHEVVGNYRPLMTSVTSWDYHTVMSANFVIRIEQHVKDC